MNNHTPINERTSPSGSQKSKVKSQNFKIFKDFISKQSIALKEARETKYWLRLLVKSEIVPNEKVADLVDECEQLMRIIAKSIVTTKGKMKND